MRNIQVGNISGNNNQINQNNVNIKNISHNGGGGNRRDGRRNNNPGDEAVGILVVVFIAVVVAAFLYLKYYEPIFFWLKVGVVVAGIVHAMSIIPQWRDSNGELPSMLHTLAGMLLATAQAYVIVAALGALPAEILEVARRPIAAKGMIPQALEVWNRFNSLGHRFITENLITVLLLMPGIALNAFYGLQRLFENLAESEQSYTCAAMANRLIGFTKWGGPAAVFLTLAAYLVVTGVLSPQPI